MSASSIDSETLKIEDVNELAAYITNLLQNLRFGSVELVVHDGKVVQIDKRERYRLSTHK